jgi:hypothetical protein
MIARRLYLIVFAVLISVGSAFGDITGSLLKDYGNLDTCNGCLFPTVQFGAQTIGQTVQSYALYAGTSTLPDTSGNWLTPIVFEQDTINASHFDVIGIGASANGFGLGLHSDVPFVLVAGTAQVQDANTFFGYLDGKLTPAGGGSFTVSKNEGTISTTYPGNSGPSAYFIGAVDSLAVNDTLTATTFVAVGQSSRTYALQVTTPEPTFFSLVGLELSGLAALAFVARRQRNRR